MSMLSDNTEFLDHYKTKRPPTIYTNQNGRTLGDGAYLSQYLLRLADEYNGQYYHSLCQEFTFKYILSIAENKEGCQHLYSFLFDTDEMFFLQHTINNISAYKNFIAQYNKHFYDDY